jgi:uncharacterized membrane protein YphA (DoxX/SURF4 family)
MLIINRIKSEPAVVAGVVQALLGLLLAFGVDLSTAQVGSVMILTAALLALVVRSQVTPTRKPAGESGQIDVGTAIVIVVLLLVLLVLLGVIGTR